MGKVTALKYTGAVLPAWEVAEAGGIQVQRCNMLPEFKASLGSRVRIQKLMSAPWKRGPVRVTSGGCWELIRSSARATSAL